MKENTAAYETEMQKCTHGFKCFKSLNTSEISIPTFSCVAVIQTLVYKVIVLN